MRVMSIFSKESLFARSVLLALYISFVMICHLIVNSGFDRGYFILGSFLSVGLSFVIAPIIVIFASRAEFVPKVDSETNRRIFLRRLLFYCIPAVVLLLFFWVYYPGAYSEDSFNQYEQAISNDYNDWHPVIHTLFAFKLPLMIGGGQISSIIVFQIVMLSVAIGYSVNTVYDLAGRGIAYLVMFFYVFNPLTGRIAMFPWKDVTFSAGSVILVCFMVRVFLTRGAWLNRITNLLVFVLTFVITSLCRHNAVLFTIPVLVVLIAYYPVKRVIMIIAVVIFVSLSIKIPLYSVLKVSRPDQRQVETLGLPLNIIGSAVTYSPESIDEDILEFAYRVAPEDVWQKYYRMGDFNTLKFRADADLDVIEEYGNSRVIDMTIRCFQESPYISLKSLIKLTDGIYTLTDEHPVLIRPYITDNPYGIKQSSCDNVVSHTIDYISTLVQKYIPHVFLYYGVLQFLVIIAMISKIDFKKIEQIKKVMIAIPMLIYNGGTSLLITSNYDSPRLFYYMILVSPVVIVMICYSEKEKNL